MPQATGNSWSRLALGAGCCLSLVASACSSGTISSDWHRIDPPIEAPAFTAPQLDGAPIQLSDYRGRVVVMDFWATWCGPCRFSLPSLEVIAKRYADRGVSVLLVNAGESKEDIRRWTKRRFDAPVLLDREGSVRQRYGVQGLPRLFVINQDGQIVYAHAGYGGGLEQNLTLMLDQLVTETTHG